MLLFSFHHPCQDPYVSITSQLSEGRARYELSRRSSTQLLSPPLLKSLPHWSTSFKPNVSAIPLSALRHNFLPKRKLVSNVSFVKRTLLIQFILMHPLSFKKHCTCPGKWCLKVGCPPCPSTNTSSPFTNEPS